MRMIALVLCLGSVACATVNPPTTVERVDLRRYAGTWFDVGHFPARFQRDCACATATYELIEPTKVSVLNRCRKGGASGRLNEIRGTARVLDEKAPSKLGVQFFPIFEAPYWIVSLDDDYRWAVVSAPGRNSLWILSRTPALDANVRAHVLADLDSRGFDLTRLGPSPQIAGCPGVPSDEPVKQTAGYSPSPSTSPSPSPPFSPSPTNGAARTP